MKSFKKIILENPDGININYGETSIGFREARYTFLIYDDLLEKKDHWIAYDYITYEILSSCKSLLTELYTTKTHPDHRKALYQLEEMKTFPAHSKLIAVLGYLGHFDSGKNNTILDGRLYEDNGNWYFPFWQFSLIKLLNKYRHHIDDFLETVNVSKDKVKFEDENEDGVFIPYNEMFDVKSSPKTVTPSDEQRRMKQMKLDLHLKKGQLDKAIVQALQSKPKDVDTLYQRLEKQLGMPIVKIKHIFGAVPLDKLIVKKAKELKELVSSVDISVSSIIKESKDEDRRLNQAYSFFKSKLGIKNISVKVVLTSLVGDEGQLKYTYKNGKYDNFIIEIDRDVDIDKKIRALAHELIHVEQLHTGMLDYVKRIWNGQVFDKEIYWKRPWESDARVRSANLWIEFNRARRDSKFKKMFESEGGNTFKMYHGGSRWSYLPDDIWPGKNNRYEAGVGIYFTNSYNTARKYAKGNKVVHLVEIDKQFKDIDDVRVSVDKITNFVKNVPQLSSKKNIIDDIISYSTRVGKTEIPLSVLNNLVVNYQAARGKSGVFIAKFFTENGADAHVQKQSGDEVWLVVFNPKILKSVKVVNPKEINSDSQFMLPML